MRSKYLFINNPKPMSKYIFNPNLKGKHHIFDEKLCDKFDKPAREKIKERLLDFVKDNEDICQQDLVITNPTYDSDEFKYQYIELQVCTNWIGERFPYAMVYVFERKKKYDSDTLFITLNRCMTRGYIFDYESIKKFGKLRRLKKYSREMVYDIPWFRIRPFEMEDLNEELIRSY